MVNKMVLETLDHPQGPEHMPFIFGKILITIDVSSKDRSQTNIIKRNAHFSCIFSFSSIFLFFVFILAIFGETLLAYLLYT